MNEQDWNIEPMQPMEFNFVPCQPAFDEMVRALGIPASLLSDDISNYSYAGPESLRILEREHKAWLEIQRRRALNEEW